MKYIAQYSILLLVALAANINLAAQENPDENSNTDTYVFSPINWKIEIPQGFKVLSSKSEKQMTQLGSDMVEDVTGAPLDLTGVKNLLSYKKNAQNSFLSLIEPYKGTLSQFEKKRHGEVILLYKMLSKQGLICDTSTGVEIIEGKEFQVIYVDLYFDKSREQVVLSQKYYSLLIGHDKVFSVILTSNNEADKKIMEDAWVKSISAIKQ